MDHKHGRTVVGVEHADDHHLRRQYVDDAIRHPPAEASHGRAATRRRAQAAAAQAKRERQS